MLANYKYPTHWHRAVPCSLKTQGTQAPKLLGAQSRGTDPLHLHFLPFHVFLANSCKGGGRAQAEQRSDTGERKTAQQRRWKSEYAVVS